MGYLGENNFFSFRDSCCEAVSEAAVSSKEASEFGRCIAGNFRRICVGCEAFRRLNIVYALCCGISEAGITVYLCDNTEMQSFRFSIPLLGCDCGIFVGGQGLTFSFFGSCGEVMNRDMLRKLLSSAPAPVSGKCGRIHTVTSFSCIYTSNIADSIPDHNSKLPAGVSCGSKAMRSLWLNFFNENDEELVFQVSDNGQKVNAYSLNYGYIPQDKLILAGAVMLTDKGSEIYLPENFHCCADEILTSFNRKAIPFSSASPAPRQALEQRYLHDMLYLCCQLASRRQLFFNIISQMPDFRSVRREIVFSVLDKLPEDTVIPDKNGRIIVSRSGRQRISLTAQAYSMETAAELCRIWTARLQPNS